MAKLRFIEKGIKRGLIALLRRILPENEQLGNLYAEQGEIKKILILRLEQKVGNVVMSTFLPRALKNIYPSVEVDILMHKFTERLWDAHPFIDRKYIFSHYRHLLNPFALFSLIFEIRSSKYDLVLDCSTPGGFSLSNGLFTMATGGKYRVGYLRGESARFLNVTVDPDYSKHYIDITHDLIYLLSPDRTVYPPEMYVSEEEKKTALDSFRKIGFEENQMTALMWVGARHNKQWPLDNFVKLADMLQERFQIEVLFLFGPEEEEHYNEFKKNDRYTLKLDSLRELMGYISTSDIFISGDAGPMHLAAALDSRMVAIFLVDNSDVYGYRDGDRKRVVDLHEDPNDIEKVFEVCEQTFRLTNVPFDRQ